MVNKPFLLLPLDLLLTSSRRPDQRLHKPMRVAALDRFNGLFGGADFLHTDRLTLRHWSTIPIRAKSRIRRLLPADPQNSQYANDCDGECNTEYFGKSGKGPRPFHHATVTYSATTSEGLILRPYTVCLKIRESGRGRRGPAARSIHN